MGVCDEVVIGTYAGGGTLARHFAPSVDAPSSCVAIGFRASRLLPQHADMKNEISVAGCVQNQTINSSRPERQIRMSAAPVGTRVYADVRGRHPDPQSAVQQRIFGAKFEREGVARLRMKRVFHYHPVTLTRGGSPGDPADEAVDRVVAFRLV